MCAVCTDFILGKLSPLEAKRNLVELAEVMDNEHLEEAERLIATFESENACND